MSIGVKFKYQLCFLCIWYILCNVVWYLVIWHSIKLDVWWNTSEFYTYKTHLYVFVCMIIIHLLIHATSLSIIFRVPSLAQGRHVAHVTVPLCEGIALLWDFAGPLLHPTKHCEIGIMILNVYLRWLLVFSVFSFQRVSRYPCSTFLFE